MVMVVIVVMVVFVVLVVMVVLGIKKSKVKSQNHESAGSPLHFGTFAHLHILRILAGGLLTAKLTITN
jgi:hypothetical protein